MRSSVREVHSLHLSLFLSLTLLNHAASSTLEKQSRFLASSVHALFLRMLDEISLHVDTRGRKILFSSPEDAFQG